MPKTSFYKMTILFEIGWMPIQSVIAILSLLPQLADSYLRKASDDFKTGG